MEDKESAGALRVGDPVLILTYGTEDAPPGKYVGFLTGMGDVFIGAKLTHEEKMLEPKVLPESQVAVRELLSKRPLWLLHLQVGFKYRMLTIGLDREGLVDRLAEWLENMAMVEVGPRPTLIEYPVAKQVWLAIDTVQRLESMADIVDSEVLLDLDFTPEPVEEGEPEPKKD